MCMFEYAKMGGGWLGKMNYLLCLREMHKKH